MRADSDQQPAPDQQPPPFTIFSRQFQEPKHETFDGRFPPSYEQAMGLETSATSVYSGPSSNNNGFTYSAWVNAESPDQNSSNNFRSSIYTVDTDQPEPYISATVVTTR